MISRSPFSDDGSMHHRMPLAPQPCPLTLAHEARERARARARRSALVAAAWAAVSRVAGRTASRLPVPSRFRSRA